MSIDIKDPGDKGANLANYLRDAIRVQTLPVAAGSLGLVVVDADGKMGQRPGLDIVTEEFADALVSLPSEALRAAADVYSKAESDGIANSLSSRATVLESGATTLSGRVSTLEAGQTSGMLIDSLFASLMARTAGIADATGAEVADGDGGTHLAATATGYDGASTPNAGRYSFKAAWGRWVRIGATATSYFSGVASAVAGANFLPDSFNEFSAIDQQYGSWNWWLNGWPTFDSSGTHSGLRTPVAKGVTVAPFFLSKWYPTADLPLKTADTAIISVLCWFANAGGTATITWRNDANASVGGTVTSSALPAGLQVVSLGVAMPAGATKLDIRLQQLDGSDYEAIGYFGSLGTAVAPARTRASIAEPRRAAGHHGKNLHPDPFFRLAERGVAPDAFLGVAPANVTLSDLAGSPFRRKKALAVTVGAAAVDSWIDIERLGLKSGDKLTVIVAVYGAQTIDMRLQFKDGANAIVVNSSIVSKAISGYDEIRITFDVTAGIISTANRMEIRMLLNNVAAAGLYIIGYGVYINSWPTRLHDDNRREEIDLSTDRPTQLGLETLRQSRLKMRQRLLGMSAVLNIGVIGNSWSALPSRWTLKFATYLQGKYGDAGSGYYQLAWSTIAGVNVGGGNGLKAWPQTVSAGADWTSTYYGTYGPSLGHITATTVGARTTIAGTAGDDAASLLYKGVAGAQLRYRWSDGGWTVINVSTAGLNWVALAGIPTVDWTLDIEVTAGLPILCGLNFSKAADGVRVHKLAANGSKASDFAAVDASWQSGIAGLNLDVAIVLHGTNDQDRYLANLYGSKLDTIIGNVRAAAPGCDVLIGVDPENNRVNGTPMRYLAASARDCALRNKVAFVDLQGVWGNPADYAYAGPRPWMDSDLIHPLPDTGGVAVFDAMIRAMEG